MKRLSAQQWNFVNGDIRGIGTLDGSGVAKCLDVAGYSTADGAVVQLWDCTGGSNQKWILRSGRIVGTASGKCLDLGTGANGVQLFIRTCNSSAAKRWAVR